VWHTAEAGAELPARPPARSAAQQPATLAPHEALGLAGKAQGPGQGLRTGKGCMRAGAGHGHGPLGAAGAAGSKGKVHSALSSIAGVRPEPLLVRQAQKA